MSVSLTIGGVRADLYGGEEITLTRKVKDLQDLSKTLTDFSQPFTLPATDTNNGIFEHFYNLDINDPYPVHEKADATLTINGIDLFVGVLELTSVTLKDLRPDNYEVTFYGRNKQLSTLWGQETLRDLSFDYGHAISPTNVKASWNGTLTANSMESGDVRYMVADFGSREAGAFVYNTQALYPNQNIAQSSGAIGAPELRPALRFNNLLEQCFTHINCNLTIDSNISDTDLYVLGMESAGAIAFDHDGRFSATKAPSSPISHTTGLLTIDNYTSETSDPSNLFTPSTGEYNPAAQGNYTFEFEYSGFDQADSVAIGLFDVTSGGLLGTFQNLLTTSPTSGTFALTIYVSYAQPNIVLKLIKGSPNTITFDSIIFRCVDNPKIASDLNIEIEQTLPDIKIHDFIGGVLKTFNALLLTDNGTDYTMQNLTDYLADGTTRDYTDKIDTQTIVIEKKDVPAQVLLKHAESDDINNAGFRAALGRPFGEVRYDNSGKYDFTSDSIEVESPFTIMPISLQNESGTQGLTTGITDLEIPLFMNGEGKAKEVPLSLWYWTGYSSCNSLWYFDEGNALVGNPVQQSSFPYFRPFDARPALSTTNSLGYSYEQDEDGVVPTNTFLTRYWLPHLDRIFNPKMRKVMVTGILEASDWLDLKMNDSLRIGGRSYKIESVKYNTQTKRAQLNIYTYDLLTRPTPTFDDDGGVTFDDAPSPQDRTIAGALKVGSNYNRAYHSAYQSQTPIVRLQQEMTHAMYLLEPRVMDMEINTTNSITLANSDYHTIDDYDTTAFNACPDFSQSQANGQFTIQDAFLTDIVFTASFADDTNKDLRFTIFVNGTATNFSAYESAGATEVNLVGLLPLVREDVVDIRVQKTDTGNFTLEIESAEFLIRRAR